MGSCTCPTRVLSMGVWIHAGLDSTEHLSRFRPLHHLTSPEQVHCRQPTLHSSLRAAQKQASPQTQAMQSQGIPGEVAQHICKVRTNKCI